ncbi:hypothetical protein AYO21_09404 [Fonsecaea monophora]|uniref:Uncharacterized protein n=1 Tax=Fonsecaea monophora TaxID=254056 RepID=A0A177EZP1_9EURO|nr:hypothetical protein AYO21_09404 [Fonsecaea monophora]KAH0834422.1 hypothetical protein FOPE_03754 [Fonsecaea pedrosoi]OAG36419.1 hypothetical protein AYO21_09404 [Fonsecaea monophora]
MSVYSTWEQSAMVLDRNSKFRSGYKTSRPTFDPPDTDFRPRKRHRPNGPLPSGPGQSLLSISNDHGLRRADDDTLRRLLGADRAQKVEKKEEPRLQQRSGLRRQEDPTVKDWGLAFSTRTPSPLLVSVTLIEAFDAVLFIHKTVKLFLNASADFGAIAAKVTSPSSAPHQRPLRPATVQKLHDPTITPGTLCTRLGEPKIEASDLDMVLPLPARNAPRQPDQPTQTDNNTLVPFTQRYAPGGFHIWSHRVVKYTISEDLSDPSAVSRAKLYALAGRCK